MDVMPPIMPGGCRAETQPCRALIRMALPAYAGSLFLPLGRGADPSGKVSRWQTAEMVEGSDLVLGPRWSTAGRLRLSPVRTLSRAFAFREFARLVEAEDAAGPVDPAAGFAALVQSAAARRGAVRAHAGGDDVDDPLGAHP